jgi:hypothetical protein
MSSPSLSLSMPVITKETPDSLEIQFVPTPLMRWVPIGALSFLGLFLGLSLALLIPIRTDLNCSQGPGGQCSETQIYLLRHAKTVIPLKTIQKVSVEKRNLKDGSPIYSVQWVSPSQTLTWSSYANPQEAENRANTLRVFLANPQAAPLENKGQTDFLPFWIMGGGFLGVSALLLSYFFKQVSGSFKLDRSRGIAEARIWSKKGPQFERFEFEQIDRFRVESHGPICLIWMQVKDQSGPWILTWGLSTGEGLRLEEKLSDFLDLPG